MAEGHIDLQEVRSPNSRVFSGQPRGKKARKHFNVDVLDKSNQIIHVIVPDDTYTVNPSFLLGLFLPSITRLGKTEFLKKYRFDSWPEELFDAVNDTIDRAIKTSDILTQIA
jgi:hypothetical protein